MKRFHVPFIAVLAVSFFMISCGDEKKNAETVADEDSVVAVDENNTDGDITDEAVIDEDAAIVDESATDEDAVDLCKDKECPEHSQCVVEAEEASCVCDEGYHPTNGLCVSDTVMTENGTFTVSFTGPVNATSDPASIVPGTGDAEFSYYGEEFTFTVLHVQDVVDFPFAANSDGGIITTTWIDAVSMTPKFFAINVPNNLAVGNDIDFVEKQIYTLYGDLSYDGTAVAIKCIRSVSGEGKLDITELTTDQIEVSAIGKMIDPVYASEMGYNLPETCAD